MRPFDAALMAQTSKDGMRDLFRARRNNFGRDAARTRQTGAAHPAVASALLRQPALIARRGAAVQPLVQHGAGARKLAALHQRDNKSVLDERPLRMAAADAHDLVEHGRKMCNAATIIAAG